MTFRHLALALPVILMTSPISVPIGWWANRSKRFGDTLLIALSLLYTIPSLPMPITIPVIVGTTLRSNMSMVIVLTLCGIATLIRQVADAPAPPPTPILEATDSPDYPLFRRLSEVGLSPAPPAILTGVHVVGASTVSLVTVGAFTGVRSLGTLFTDGFQRGLISEVLSNLVTTVTAAFVLDILFIFLDWVVTSWTRPQERLGQARKARVILGASV